MAKKKPTKKKAPADEKAAPRTALQAIEMKYGKGAARAMGDAAGMGYDVYSTGSIGLDGAIGIGGLPRGRVVEVYGPESSGKTTLCLHVIASAQATGAKAMFIDAEHALDPTYAAAIGVDVENLVVSQPDYGEMALDILDMAVRSAEFGVVVVDSVAALTPKAELDGEIMDHHMALQARMMSKVMRRLCAVTAKTQTLVVFINQLRSKVGVIFGSPEVTPGGNALKFYASVRLDVRRKSAVKQGEELVAMGTRVKVVKNKVGRPFGEAYFDIAFGIGIDGAGEVLDLAVEAGIAEKAGAWYSYKGERLGQGRANAIDFLRAHGGIQEAIRRKVRKEGE